MSGLEERPAAATLEVGRDEIVAFRLRAGGLDARRPRSAEALRRAAWAGAQDSMPRAAVLSLHARMDDVDAAVLDHPSLVQIWGPRHQLYVVAAEDLAVFTLGRLPTDARGRRRALDMVEGAGTVLEGGAELPFAQVSRALGIPHNALRYAAPTGRLLVRWDGARQPTVRLAPPPDVDERDARHELARRHLHVQGPSTWRAFARWAGVGSRQARTTFEQLATALVPVRTPIGDGWVLEEDEAALRAGMGRMATASVCCRAATPSGCSSTSSGSCSLPTRPTGRCCGRRASGRGRCSSVVTWPGPGGGLGRPSTSSPGAT